MSAVCILTPVVIAAWPAFSAAVVAAASSLGYTVADHFAEMGQGASKSRQPTRVDLEVPQSELVTDSLSRQQQICVVRGDVSVVFSRDARGKAAVCVTGEGHTREELQALGTELSGRVVQQYVYQKLIEEMASRRFVVVEQERDENDAIRIKVRHWEE